MVTAILPNWNGERFLDAILPDLAAQTHPPARIIVVDNGSTDGSLACARRHRADIVALAENRGFAHAVNRGIHGPRRNR
jgi:glycosyltransferase involved in cell wall biosynthesis